MFNNNSLNNTLEQNISDNLRNAILSRGFSLGVSANDQGNDNDDDQQNFARELSAVNISYQQSYQQSKNSCLINSRPQVFQNGKTLKKVAESSSAAVKQTKEEEQEEIEESEGGELQSLIVHDSHLRNLINLTTKKRNLENDNNNDADLNNNQKSACQSEFDFSAFDLPLGNLSEFDHHNNQKNDNNQGLRHVNNTSKNDNFDKMNIFHNLKFFEGYKNAVHGYFNYFIALIHFIFRLDRTLDFKSFLIKNDYFGVLYIRYSDKACSFEDFFNNNEF